VGVLEAKRYAKPWRIANKLEVFKLPFDQVDELCPYFKGLFQFTHDIGNEEWLKILEKPACQFFRL
jgi:hypothetical protein